MQRYHYSEEAIARRLRPKPFYPATGLFVLTMSGLWLVDSVVSGGAFWPVYVFGGLLVGAVTYFQARRRLQRLEAELRAYTIEVGDDYIATTTLEPEHGQPALRFEQDQVGRVVEGEEYLQIFNRDETGCMYVPRDLAENGYGMIRATVSDWALVEEEQ